MENCSKIIPPHLNAEVYRSDVTGTHTFNYLDFVKIHSDGSLLIGCSELTGRYWNGGVYIYKNWEEFQENKTNLKLRITLASGTADGCFIENSNKVLLCEDSGRLSIWAENNVQCAWKVWNEEIIVAGHDDAALGVDCLKPASAYVTVGADGNAKVWDINEMICIRNYADAHSRAIQTVAVRPNSSVNFATGSLDYYVSMWDENTALPAINVVKNDCGVRCLQWIDENQIVFGDDAGSLSLVDIRNPKPIKLVEFPAPVHQVSVQPETKQIAVCCDNRIVTICDIEGTSVKVVSQNRNAHTNYVRSVKWDHKQSNVVYSSGWDGEVKMHKL